MRWLVPAVLCALAWYVLRLSACRHVDEDGRSLLMWTWSKGRVRGYCTDCERLTTGWLSGRPQFNRLPSARKATKWEVAWLRRGRDRALEQRRRA